MAKKPRKRSQFLEGRQYKDLDASERLGRAETYRAVLPATLGFGAAITSGFTGAMAVVNAFTGNPVSTAAYGLASVASYHESKKALDTASKRLHTGDMITRAGMNPTQSHRMAETLSMTSLHTGVTGPQSLGGDLRGRAKATTKARGKKAAAKKAATKKTAPKVAAPPAAPKAGPKGVVKAHARRQAGKTTRVTQHRREISI